MADKIKYKDKKIAVVGVSDREEKFGFKIFRDLLAQGFDVYGVNPRGGEVLGKQIYKSLKDLRPIPDVVITVVPHQITERIVDECAVLGVKELWMQLGSESDLAIQKAKKSNLNFYSGCFMARNGIW